MILLWCGKVFCCFLGACCSFASSKGSSSKTKNLQTWTSPGTPVAKVMNWRARGGLPKGAPQMWPDVYPSRPKKGPSGGAPRIGLGALLGQTRPWETLILTTVVEFPNQQRAGQKADAEIRDLGSILGVPLGGPSRSMFHDILGSQNGSPFRGPRIASGRVKVKRAVLGTPQKVASGRAPEPEPNSR